MKFRCFSWRVSSPKKVQSHCLLPLLLLLRVRHFRNFDSADAHDRLETNRVGRLLKHKKKQIELSRKFVALFINKRSPK
jgi:hypothetical protein